MLARIWAGVLGVERLGVHDGFLQLGGDSILAAQLVSRVREATKAEVPLLALCGEASTVAGMAELLGDGPAGEAQRQGVGPEAAVQERPLSFAQERQWFLKQWDPANPVYNRPFALRLAGPLNVETLRDALGAVVARHEALRATFTVAGGRPFQVIRPAGPLDLPVVDLSALPRDDREARAAELAREEARRPFSLAQGPLVRASLLRLAAKEHVLVLNLHHIFSDGWSMGVFYRELGALYQAFRPGGEPSLPDFAIQYAVYALGQPEG